MNSYDPDNIFAKILRKEIPCTVIFDTEHSLAIMDAFPCVAGHSLLIPKVETANLEDIGASSPEFAAGIMKDLARLNGAVRRAFSADATTVQVNNGPAAGQIVSHVHFHVIPRKTGDKLITLPKSASLMISLDEGEKAAGLIRNELI